MEKEVFLHICKVCGNQSRPEEERWKDIVYVGLAHDRNIANFNKKIQNDHVIFIDKTEEGGTIGFYVLENLPSQVSFTNEHGPYMSFVPLSTVRTISFKNMNNLDKLSEFFENVYNN